MAAPGGSAKGGSRQPGTADDHPSDSRANEHARLPPMGGGAMRGGARFDPARSFRSRLRPPRASVRTVRQGRVAALQAVRVRTPGRRFALRLCGRGWRYVAAHRANRGDTRMPGGARPGKAAFQGPDDGLRARAAPWLRSPRPARAAVEAQPVGSPIGPEDFARIGGGCIPGRGAWPFPGRMDHRPRRRDAGCGNHARQARRRLRRMARRTVRRGGLGRTWELPSCRVPAQPRRARRWNRTGRTRRDSPRSSDRRGRGCLRPASAKRRWPAQGVWIRHAALAPPRSGADGEMTCLNIPRSSVAFDHVERSPRPRNRPDPSCGPGRSALAFAWRADRAGRNPVLRTRLRCSGERPTRTGNLCHTVSGCFHDPARSRIHGQP